MHTDTKHIHIKREKGERKRDRQTDKDRQTDR